jgi:hypothetical protein
VNDFLIWLYFDFFTTAGGPREIEKSVVAHRSCNKLTPHTSHLTPHTSHLTPHTSHLTPHTSHLTPHTSHLTPHLRKPLTTHKRKRRWVGAASRHAEHLAVLAPIRGVHRRPRHLQQENLHDSMGCVFHWCSIRRFCSALYLCRN